MDIVFIVFWVMVGAGLGSFACCQAWRWRLKTTGKKDPGKRSVCLKCGKQLKWYENVPIISWLAQGGKCRGCGKKIGTMEIWSEVAGAAMFGMVGWKYAGVLIGGKMGGLMAAEWVLMIIRVVFLTLLLILAIYDAKWRELPMKLLMALNLVAGGYAIVSLGEIVALRGDVAGWAMATLGAVALLAGIYYLLYFFSREKLVGGGDWLMCLAIGLVIQNWWLAMWVLFLSNLIGAVVMIPQKKKKMAFGPFLTAGFVIVWTMSEVILGYI